MKTQLLLVTLFIVSIGYSQRTCGTQAHMQEKLKNSEFNLQYQARQQKFEENLKKLETSNRRYFRQTYTIPVAVHFPEGSESDRACLEQLAQSQIDVLNADYSATNSDISKWDSAKIHYPGVTPGVCSLQFLIATENHPANTDADLVEGGLAVTIGYNFGNGADSDSKWDGYMNFVVKDIGENLLGYSVLGGNPNSGDSVVMNTFAFGVTGSDCAGYSPNAPYNLGRTVTHELGHHYNLYHTWGSGGGDTSSCNDDDGVADTPAIDGATYSCPADGSVTKCNTKALTMNFMDYVNDSCMYMFTEGQANRVVAYMNTIFQSYNQNTLSLNTINLSKTFVAYPNPTKDKITITVTSNLIKNNAEVKLIDVLGKVVKSTTIKDVLSDESIDVKDLNNGLYLLKLTAGELTVIKKVIINK